MWLLQELNYTAVFFAVCLYLQSPHGLGVLVSFHLTGHQQLCSGGCHLFCWGDEFLFAGVALHRGVGCLTQVAGCCCYHTRLTETIRWNIFLAKLWMHKMAICTYSGDKSLGPLSIIHSIGWDGAHFPLSNQLSLGSWSWFDQSASCCSDGFGCLQNLLLKVQRLVC